MRKIQYYYSTITLQLYYINFCFRQSLQSIIHMEKKGVGCLLYISSRVRNTGSKTSRLEDAGWYKCQVFLMEKHWLRCIKELYLHGLFYVSTSPLFIVILKDEDLWKNMEKLGFLSCCFPYYITLKFFKSLSIYFLADQYFWTNTVEVSR